MNNLHQEILEEFADAARPYHDRFEERSDAHKLQGVADRFWSKVDLGGGPNACWPWRAENSDRFEVFEGLQKEPRHVAWWLHHGSFLPTYGQLRVTCGDRRCCNPLHIVKALSEADRFWAKVDKTAGADACWPWTGARYHNGGPLFSSTKSGGVRARRFAWKLITGDDPGKLYVLPKCLDRICMNPAHLFLGTQVDKIRIAHESGAIERARQKNMVHIAKRRARKVKAKNCTTKLTRRATELPIVAAMPAVTFNPGAADGPRSRAVRELNALLEQARSEVARIQAAIDLVTGSSEVAVG